MEIEGGTFAEVPAGKSVVRVTSRCLATGAKTVDTVIIANRPSNPEALPDVSNGLDDAVHLVIQKRFPPSLEEQRERDEVKRDDMAYERAQAFWDEYTIDSLVTECVQPF